MLVASIILLTCTLLSGVIREWFCSGLWNGKFKIPYCVPLCGGYAFSSSMIGSVVTFAGFPGLWVLIFLAWLAWILTWVLTLVMSVAWLTIEEFKYACDDDVAGELLNIFNSTSPIFEDLDADELCDDINELTHQGRMAWIGATLLFVAAVHFLITIVDKYRLAEREKVLCLQKKELLDDSNAERKRLMRKQFDYEDDLKKEAKKADAEAAKKAEEDAKDDEEDAQEEAKKQEEAQKKEELIAAAAAMGLVVAEPPPETADAGTQWDEDEAAHAADVHAARSAIEAAKRAEKGFMGVIGLV